MSIEEAVFGAGCFWGVEEAFREVEGVVDTAVGYCGGATANPSYKDVCTGTTGHAEVVRVSFDTDKTTFDDLLDVFWNCHNPTMHNRQGPDVGSQYRSVIFFQSEDQEDSARATCDAVAHSGQYQDAIVTEISPACTFYMAEDYHQKHVQKNPQAGCSINQNR